MSAQRQELSPELTGLLAGAELVLEGSIAEPGTSVRSAQGYLETPYQLNVKRVLAGAASASGPLEVYTAGGTLDGLTESVSHGTTLAPGVAGIFLLAPRAEGGYYLHGGNAGKVTRLAYDDDYEAIHWGRLTKYSSWRSVRERIGAAVGTDLSIAALSADQLRGITSNKEFCVKLDNPVPNVQDKTVEFDVLAKSSVAGLKFGRAEIIIDYPAGNLGEFIVDQEKIEAEKGDISDSPAYTIDVKDETEDRISLTVESPCDNAEPHYVLDTVYEKLAKLTVKVNEWGNLGTMNVNDFDIAGTAEYVNPASVAGTPGCTEFEDLCGEGAFGFMPCTISSITPNLLSAGIGNIATIQGNNFGSGIGGEILLNNADNGGASKLIVEGLDEEVIVSWSDSQIKFRVESKHSADGDGNGPGPFSPFGSGDIIIDPDVTSTDPNTLRCVSIIDINYALWNGHDSTENVDKLWGLALNPVSFPDESIFFDLDLGIESDTNLLNQGLTIDAVEQILLDVLCKWEQVADINLIYNGRSDTRGAQGVFVTFTNLATPGLTRFITSGFACQADMLFIDNFNDAIVQLDDQLSFDREWYVGPQQSISSNETDLYSVMLHEVGHALGYTHNMDTDTSNDPNDDRTMFWRVEPGQVRRDVDSLTASGLQFNSSESRLATASGRCFAGKVLSAVSGSCPSVVSSIQENVSELDWSYDYNNKVIQIGENSVSKLILVIFDVSGRIVTQREVHNHEQLDVGSLVNGVYTAKLISQSESEAKVFAL